MAPAAQSSARIFEDPPAVRSFGHYNLQSIEDGYLEHQHNTDPQRTHGKASSAFDDPSPLGERHINSPPHPRKIPLKNEADARPTMHKKSGSSTSLKVLLRGKEKSTENRIAGLPLSDSSPKKTKSATNLVGLLKKKSKKDLKDSTVAASCKLDSPNKSLSTDHGRSDHVVQPSGRSIIISNQQKRNRTVEEEISLYTPKDYSEYRPHEQRNFHAYERDAYMFESPRRPFLEHKTSRSSIFTEELDENDKIQDQQKSTPNEVASYQPHVGHQNPQRVAEIDDLPAQNDKLVDKKKRSSRIFDTIAALNMKSRRDDTAMTPQEAVTPMSTEDLDSAMENMLGRYDIPQNLRDQLRNLKPEVKAGLMKGDRVGSGSSDQSLQERERARSPEKKKRGEDNEDSRDGKRTRSRSRTRSRILSLSKRGEGSPSKSDTRVRSNSKGRPKSMDLGWAASAKGLSSTTSLAALNSPDSAVTPGDFIHYLKEVQKPALVEVGKIHKLRILLRNESVAWTDAFVKKGGMDEIVQLLYRIMDIEWREEHEDNLLHETLLCMKGLSTTKLAMQRLEVVGASLFPALLRMLFDPERKGPAEYNTRGIIISLLFSHLSATLHGDLNEHKQRARQILLLMQDPGPVDDKQPLDFVSQMHTSRPYRTWCKEVTNVTKEVFWIFLHHMNVVPVGTPIGRTEEGYTRAYFPTLRAPHPAAPYVGGVEWEATQYLALHLDLLNGLIVSLPTVEERNSLRDELRQSGWEKTMGGSLRTCKEKFYGGVHDGLRSWVSAASRDGWLVEDVRAGPPRDTSSPKKSPAKKDRMDEAPKISLDVGAPSHMDGGDGWL